MYPSNNSTHGKWEMPEPVEYVPEGHEAQVAELVAPARDMESNTVSQGQTDGGRANEKEASSAEMALQGDVGRHKVHIFMKREKIERERDGDGAGGKKRGRVGIIVVHTHTRLFPTPSRPPTGMRRDATSQSDNDIVYEKLAKTFGYHTCTQTTDSVILQDMTAHLAMFTPQQTVNPSLFSPSFTAPQLSLTHPTPTPLHRSPFLALALAIKSSLQFTVKPSSI